MRSLKGKLLRKKRVSNEKDKNDKDSENLEKKDSDLLLRKLGILSSK